MDVLVAKRWRTAAQVEAEKGTYFNRFMGIRDPRLAAIQAAQNQFRALSAERIYNAMFPPDATLKKGEGFTLKLKAVDLNVTGGRYSPSQNSTLLMDKTLTEAARERLIEEYRQGGGVNCLLQYAGPGRLILTLTTVDRNGDTLFFIGPKQIALVDPITPKAPRKKRKYSRKVKLADLKIERKK